MSLINEFKQAIADRDKRIAELEAIVVQQRDGFFEQDNRITELKAENERLRERRKEDDWYEEHMEGDVHHVEVTKIPKTLFD